MAQVVWTKPALADLDTIADYIALDNSEAARHLVQRVFKPVEQLERHPKSGSVPSELRGSRYRQIVEPPCRVFYRSDGKRVWILHVMRSERLLRPNTGGGTGKLDRSVAHEIGAIGRTKPRAIEPASHLRISGF